MYLMAEDNEVGFWWRFFVIVKNHLTDIVGCIQRPIKPEIINTSNYDNGTSPRSTSVG